MSAPINSSNYPFNSISVFEGLAAARPQLNLNQNVGQLEQPQAPNNNEEVDFLALLQNYQQGLREFRAQIEEDGLFDNILEGLVGNNEEEQESYELAEPIDPDGRLAQAFQPSPEPLNLPQGTQTPPPSANSRRSFSFFPGTPRTQTQTAPTASRSRSNSI